MLKRLSKEHTDLFTGYYPVYWVVGQTRDSLAKNLQLIFWHQFKKPRPLRSRERERKFLKNRTRLMIFQIAVMEIRQDLSLSGRADFRRSTRKVVSVY